MLNSNQGAAHLSISTRAQKAIVAGGASGLGLAVVKSIVAQQGCVTILDLNEAQGEAISAELGEAVHFIPCDIRVPEQVESAVSQGHQFANGLNVMVNCAGILGAGRLLGRKGPMDPEYFRHVMEVNLFGSFLLTRAAAIHMANSAPNEVGERGVVIHTASIAAYEGQAGQSAYAASKAGITGMILPLARELATQGIRVMAIAPGVFATPMMASVKADVRAAIEADIPFPSRMGHPDEYADLVQSIIHNQMFNGSVIRLDGAMRLR